MKAELQNQLLEDQSRGRWAENLLITIKPALEERGRQYVLDLVRKTRQKGDVENAEVWKIIALADIEQDLARMVDAGRSAARRMERETLSEIGEHD